MAVQAQTRSTAPPLRPLERDPLSAPEMAEEVRATLRQIQIWTDHQVIRCLPGTQHIGRGKKRLYDPWELPVAAVASVLVRFRFPIGLIYGYAEIVRNFLHENQPKDHYELRSRDWYRQAIRGAFPSWIACVPERVNEAILIRWEDDENIVKLIKSNPANVLINVQMVISPLVR